MILVSKRWHTVLSESLGEFPRDSSLFRDVYGPGLDGESSELEAGGSSIGFALVGVTGSGRSWSLDEIFSYMLVGRARDQIENQVSQLKDASL